MNDIEDDRDTLPPEADAGKPDPRWIPDQSWTSVVGAVVRAEVRPVTTRLSLLGGLLLLAVSVVGILQWTGIQSLREDLSRTRQDLERRLDALEQRVERLEQDR